MKADAEILLKAAIAYLDGAFNGIDDLDRAGLSDNEKCQALSSIASCLRTCASRIDEAVSVQLDERIH